MKDRCQVNKVMLPIKASYFFVLAGIASFAPFMNVYLRYLGLSESETGIIFGARHVIGASIRPLFGLITDKLQKHKFMLTLCCVMTGLFCGVCYFVPKAEKTSLVELSSVGGNFLHESGDIYLQICKKTQRNGKICHNYPATHRDYITDGCVLSCKFVQNKKLPKIYMNNTYLFAPNETVSKVGKPFTKFSVISSLNHASQFSSDGGGESTTQTYKMTEFLCVNDSRTPSGCRRYYSINGTALGEKPQYQWTNHCTVRCPAPERYGVTFWVIFVLLVLAFFFYDPVLSLIDAVAYSFLGENRGDWGLSRMWGAIGYATACFATGVFLQVLSKENDEINFIYLFTATPVMYLFAAMSVFFYKDDSEVKCENVFKNTWILLRQIDVLLLLVIAILFGMVTGVVEVFLFWFLQDLCAPNILLGITLFASCVLETPILAISGQIIEKIGYINCLFIVALTYMVRVTGYSFLYNPWFVLTIEPLHGLTFGLMYPATSNYASEITPKGMHGTVQGLLGAAHFGIGRGLGSLLSGFVAELIGLRWMFRSCCLFPVTAVLLSLLLNIYHKGSGKTGGATEPLGDSQVDIASEKEKNPGHAVNEIELTERHGDTERAERMTEKSPILGESRKQNEQKCVIL